MQRHLFAVKSAMSNAFPLNSSVRFTQERLSVLTPRDRQGLSERIGLVQTDGSKIEKPTVYFPATGAQPELRLFRMDPRHLELVESPVDSGEEPRPDDGVDHADLPDKADIAEPAAPDAGERLSQSDMDNLFN